MKRLFTFLFVVSVLSVCARAEDATVVENFSGVGNVATNNYTWTAPDKADLCEWSIFQAARRLQDTIHTANQIQAIWMSVSSGGAAKVSTTNFEGGIKAVAFKYARYGSEKTAGRVLQLKVTVGETEYNTPTFANNAMKVGNGASANHETYSHAFNSKNNTDQLSIENISTHTESLTSSGICRILVGDITITPYLRYTTKTHTMKVGDTYTNAGLIDNTEDEGSITYTLEDNDSEASINASTGEVTALADGEVTVKATWSEGAYTTYTLTIVSRTPTTASFANAAVRLGLGDAASANTLTKTAGYDGTISYTGDNDAVATVNNSTGIVALSGGVGQVTITATLPQTDDYEGTTASYTIYVRDNDARVEDFSNISVGGGIVGDEGTDWTGVYFNWRATGAIRRNASDTIWGKADSNKKVWIATKASTATTPVTKEGVLSSKEAIEGGIKHLSFYWKQWASESNRVLRVAAFAGDTRKGYMEYTPNGASTLEKFLFGANDVMRSNAILSIKNESYTNGTFDGTIADDGASCKSRIIIDDIYITPYLLYTTKEHTLDLRTATSCTYTPDVDNTESGTITYSLEDNDGEATIDAASGTVTGIKAGELTVKATWSEGAYTTYTLTILAKSVAEPSFAKQIVRVGLDEAVDNSLSKDNHDGTAAYSSSNTAVASVASDGAITINGVGQTTITVTLPETENYFAAEASYNLYVRDNDATIKEHFKNVANGTGSIGTKDTIWTGVAFDWKPEGAIRHNSSDTIWGTSTKNRSIWIATTAEAGGNGVLGSKDVIEGGIKYLSFYWQQWGAGANTLRLATFAGDTRKEYMERPGTNPSTYEKFLFGANNFMKKNEKLYIKNESYSGAEFDPANITTANSRMIIDTVFITPYLLYTNKTLQSLRIGDNTYKRIPDIDNTDGESGTLSYSSSNTDVATVASDGTVTANARGKVTITAKYKWSESEYVTTTYPVEVYPVNCETFDGIAQTGNYTNTTPREGDKATWTTSLGGFNVGDCAALTKNLVRFRAPNNANEKAYIESSAIEGGIASMTFDYNVGGSESTTEWDIRILINGREVKKLTNTEIALTNVKSDGFLQISVDGINEPGNFAIRFENHSTIGGTYPKSNKARLLIDNIVWTSYDGTKTLAENAYNDGWISSNSGETRTVEISRSAMFANVYNTICLPFAISKADDLDDADVQEMTSASIDGDVLTIGFSALDGDELQAGKPYLVKPTSNKDISGTYSSKQISSIASPVTFGSVTLQGIYSPTPLKANDYSTLFVGVPDDEGNNLFYPSEDASLKGFRAYFKINEAMGAPIRHARFVTDQTNTATGSEEVRSETVATVRSEKILENGQLIIIRDGVRYDVLGRKK